MENYYDIQGGSQAIRLIDRVGIPDYKFWGKNKTKTWIKKLCCQHKISLMTKEQKPNEMLKCNQIKF